MPLVSALLSPHREGHARTGCPEFLREQRTRTRTHEGHPDACGMSAHDFGCRRPSASAVPAELLAETEKLAPYLAKSYDYARGLKPKPKTRNPRASS